jgi:stress-induced morphogen
MAKIVRGSKDAMVKALKEAMERYEHQYPGSRGSLYRQNPADIRVRIIDERFAKMSRWKRHNQVWKFLADIVGDDIISEVSTLILLPPKELKRSFANMDFEEPLPARP